MLRSIFAFEARYHLRQPLFYIVFVTFGLLAFFATTTDAVRLGGAIGNVHRNAPAVIFQIFGILGLLGVFVSTAFVASSAQRDFENGAIELFATKPMKKTHYLLGRYGGSLAVSLLIYLGPVLGILIGTQMPWLEPERLGPFSLAPYLFSLFVLVLPSLLATSAAFFALAAFTRSLPYTFLGAVNFFVGYQVSNVLLKDAENLSLASLADPFGLAALGVATRYFTVAELNSAIPALVGPLLWNRLLWIAVGFLLLALVSWRFTFEKMPAGFSLRRHRQPQPQGAAQPARAQGARFLKTRPSFTGSTVWHQYLRATLFEVQLVFRSAPFLVILAFGAFNIVAGADFSEQSFGTPVYPVTHLMLEAIRESFIALLAIILTFYAGELVFRERGLRLADVSDALPAPNGVFVAAKLSALALITASALAVAALTTLIFQLWHGYTRFELLLYAQGLAIDSFPFLVAACLAFLFQVATNNKFLGYLTMTLFLLSGIVLRILSLDHNIYRITRGPEVIYSDMNGFGHFLPGYFAFSTYRAGLAAIFVGLSLLLWVRGRDHDLKTRLALAAARLRGRTRLALLFACLGTVAAGSYVFYNTNYLNTFHSGKELRALRASYEKTYRPYRDLSLPRVVAAKIDVDLYPEERRMVARGTYTLENQSKAPQRELHYQLEPEIELRKFELPAHRERPDPLGLGYHILELAEPLAPGARLEVSFELAYGQKGFVNDRIDTRLAENGSFFTNRDFFPSFSYDDRLELEDRTERRENGLAPAVHWPPASELAARRNNYVSRDAGWIDFETTVSTSADQIAIAPGNLVKEWQEGGRRYFHYRVETPVLHFFAYLSARYAVRQERWHDVAIEIYYDPQHPYNLDRMVKGAKKALDYCSREFGPYPHRALRIVEFPRYARYAQSFPATVPFSESIGFIAKIDEATDIDYVFYVTAHEVAHQWWGDQVIGGAVQGATMLSESFAQYSALMVMEKEYGAEKMRRFLAFELDRYLDGRGQELEEEMPLAKVENQPYVHYRKGSLVFYALRDYLGEEKLNRALRRFHDANAFAPPPFATAEEFLVYLREEAGPEQQGLIDDLLNRVTLLDNRAEKVSYRRNADGSYKVRVEAALRKLYADGRGQETEAPLDLELDLGVFGEGDQLLFLAKRKVSSGRVVFEVDVAEKPVRAGFDPFHKWIDRNPHDNLLAATAATAAGEGSSGS